MKRIVIIEDEAAAGERKSGGTQEAAAAYLAAAAENSDPALCSLFQELAGEEALHAQTLRELLEQL